MHKNIFSCSWKKQKTHVETIYGLYSNAFKQKYSFEYSAHGVISGFKHVACEFISFFNSFFFGFCFYFIFVIIIDNM